MDCIRVKYPVNTLSLSLVCCVYIIHIYIYTHTERGQRSQSQRERGKEKIKEVRSILCEEQPRLKSFPHTELSISFFPILELFLLFYFMYMYSITQLSHSIHFLFFVLNFFF